MVFHNLTTCLGVGSDRTGQPAEALSPAPCQRARAAHDRRAVIADLSKGLPVDLVHEGCVLRSSVACCQKNCMCELIVNALFPVYQLRPLLFHASPFGVRPAQALAREAPPVDDICDGLLFLGAASELFASPFSYVFKALYA